MGSKPFCPAPMKINKIPEGKESVFPSLCVSGEYFAQIKKDGYWYQFEKDSKGRCYLWSRNVSVETGMLTEKLANAPQIEMALKVVPPGTIIIGEVYYPGKRSKDVTPIMGALPKLAIERQQGEYDYLHYYVHDIIFYDGYDLMDVRADVRYDILKKVYKKYHFDLWKDNHLRTIVELAERVDDNIQEACAKALANGEEGMVLKKRTAPYTPGKRPAWDTIKIKKTDTCDAVIMDVCAPTKEYTGKELDSWGFNIKADDGTRLQGTYQWLKDNGYDPIPVTKAYYYNWYTAVEIGAYDSRGKLVSIGTVSSGLTDEDRANCRAYIGKVCELAGMEKDKQAHTLRHFHFIRLRDDKNPKECTIKEIFS